MAVNGRGAYAARMSIPAQVGVSFLRSKLLPAAIVLLFALALVAVSARIWLPGEIEYYRMRDRLEHGVPLAPAVVASLSGLAAELKLADRLE